MSDLVGKTFENIGKNTGLEKIIITEEFNYGIKFDLYRFNDDEKIGSGTIAKFMLEKDFIEV